MTLSACHVALGDIEAASLETRAGAGGAGPVPLLTPRTLNERLWVPRFVGHGTAAELVPVCESTRRIHWAWQAERTTAGLLAHLPVVAAALCRAAPYLYRVVCALDIVARYSVASATGVRQSLARTRTRLAKLGQPRPADGADHALQWCAWCQWCTRASYGVEPGGGVWLCGLLDEERRYWSALLTKQCAARPTLVVGVNGYLHY